MSRWHQQYSTVREALSIIPAPCTSASRVASLINGCCTHRLTRRWGGNIADHETRAQRPTTSSKRQPRRAQASQAGVETSSAPTSCGRCPPESRDNSRYSCRCWWTGAIVHNQQARLIKGRRHSYVDQQVVAAVGYQCFLRVHCCSPARRHDDTCMRSLPPLQRRGNVHAMRKLRHTSNARCASPARRAQTTPL